MHVRELVGVWIPVVITARDGVIAVEDRHTVMGIVFPLGAAVGERLGEEDDRSSGTLVGFPHVMVAILAQPFRQIEESFVGAGEKERAVSFLHRLSSHTAWVNPLKARPGRPRYAWHRSAERSSPNPPCGL